MKQVLDLSDKQSACWLRLKDHYQSRLLSLNEQNSGDYNEVDTAKLRGRIKEVKLFLSMGDEPPDFVPMEPEL